ncbi:FtsX-like permease family protein, partial [Fulvivirga sp. RKSG066]|uniref:ABC transporter permease n=1 Tax=Fulvivirga aurantia TaxID=2529383 RepID=UPI0012BD61AA
MLKNYFKTAVRSLLRNKGYTLINVFGLGLGLCCAVILFLLAHYVSSYDSFQENYDRVYRLVNTSIGQGGEKDHTPGVPLPLPEALRTDFPELERIVLTRNHHGERHFTIEPDSEKPKFYELKSDRLVYTQPEYFDIFTVIWLEGNRNKALEQPNSIVVSKSIADKFFPSQSALGETIILNKETQLLITGVVEDAPANTDFPFNMFVSLATVQDEIKESGWGSVSSDDHCYILLAENDSPSRYTNRIERFVEKHIEDNDQNSVYQLQPMRDFHFNEHWSNYSFKSVSKNQILIMRLIGLFLILTACINFVNLSTAVAIRRSREVGVRKVLGSSRGQLIAQFLAESFGIIFLSALIGLGLAELLLLYVNPFMDVNLDIPWFEPSFILGVVFGLFSITVLSGFYPALILSGFKPALALKNLITTKNSGKLNLRKGLVVFQFFISQVFIIGTIVTLSQLNYIKNADLGYNTEALINIRIPEDDQSKKQTIKQQLSQLSGVNEVSLVFSNPSSGSVSVSDFRVEDDPEEYYSAMKFGDENYLTIYQLKLLAGRNLRPSDTLREVIVNEKFLEYINHKGSYEEAIGKQLKVWGKHIPIVGVVKDFHAVSLRNELMTIMIFSHMNAYRTITLKVDMANFNTTRSTIEKTWKAIYPEFDYEHEFVDEQLAQFYEGERKMTIFFSAASAIAIFIGCLGLFGLASFMVSQKVKEIGVRKVLGASSISIIGLFTTSYIKLIVLAFVLAAPVAWIIMSEWLQNFQYKISLGPVVFITALVATLLIAVLTVGYKSLRAALANPVD